MEVAVVMKMRRTIVVASEPQGEGAALQQQQ